MTSKPDAEFVKAQIAKAAAGDHSAMTILYDTFAPDLYRYAQTLVHNQDIADDVVSEAFLRAWTHLPGFKDGNFKAYLYTIARNYAFDTLKKDKQCVSLAEEPEDKTRRNDILKNAIATEQHDKIFTALKHLPPTYREVVVLRFFDELSTKETAHILGKTDIWVRVTQCRALRKLQKLLS